jgi:hypothetical protein
MAVDLTKARARARAVVTAINCKGAPCLAFARASQNVVVVVELLDTLPVPSTDVVDKEHHELKDILGVAIAQ